VGDRLDSEKLFTLSKGDIFICVHLRSSVFICGKKSSKLTWRINYLRQTYSQRTHFYRQKKGLKTLIFCFYDIYLLWVATALGKLKYKILQYIHIDCRVLVVEVVAEWA